MALVTSLGLAILQSVLWLLDLAIILPLRLSNLLTGPALAGLLVLLLMKWGELEALGIAQRRARIALILALVAPLAISLVSDPGLLPALLIFCALAALIWRSGQLASDGAMALSGLAVGVALLLLATGFFADWIEGAPQWGLEVAGLIEQLVSGVAVVLPALLVYTSLRDKDSALRSVTWLRLGAAIALLGLAAYAVAQEGRFAAATSAPAEDHYPYLQLLAASVSGMLLLISLKPGQRLASPAFTIVVSFLMILAFHQSWKSAAGILPSYVPLPTLCLLLAWNPFQPPNN